MGLSLSVELQIVGTGVPDGPPPAHRSSLSGLCYLRTVEDAGPYKFNLFVGFKQFDKPQFDAHRSPFKGTFLFPFPFDRIRIYCY